MTEGKKAGDVLATADFHLTGKGWEDAPVDETIHAELYVSGAFQYGNQTGVSLEWANGTVDTYDTRYSNVTPENFREFAKALLENRVMSSIDVEAIE